MYMLIPLSLTSARPTPVFRDERILANGAAKDCAEVSFHRPAS